MRLARDVWCAGDVNYLTAVHVAQGVAVGLGVWAFLYWAWTAARTCKSLGCDGVASDYCEWCL